MRIEYMQIWITAHPWYLKEDGKRSVGYQWEFFKGDNPIAKSSPKTGETYFCQKQSAIDAAKRMREIILPDFFGIAQVSKSIPIFDVTNRAKKRLIKGKEK